MTQLETLLPFDWPLPRGVRAAFTTRLGGVSEAPWDSFNLGAHVGDAPAHVAVNRARLRELLELPGEPGWLSQVHGAEVADLDAPGAPGIPTADAAVTSAAGRACVIMVADCLPVLFAAPLGRGVAAAHAGWRGLAAGVLEATVAGLCEAAGCRPADLDAWLGVCIGPRAFEVGADVLEAFAVGSGGPDPRRFTLARPGKWLADLAGLAQDRLAAAGVARLSAAAGCAFEDASRFFSYRRDRVTGRMAAAVWIAGGEALGG